MSIPESADARPDELQETNVENLREVERPIASLVIFSSDGKMLMGRKDPGRGGVYPNAWHIPGGGVDEENGESLEEAAVREGKEEVGLELTPDQLRPIPFIGKGQTVKTLPSGERVWCKMTFNRFEVRLDKTADELMAEVAPGDDLIEVRFFSRDELAGIEQIPGGKEFMIQADYIDAA